MVTFNSNYTPKDFYNDTLLNIQDFEQASDKDRAFVEILYKDIRQLEEAQVDVQKISKKLADIAEPLLATFTGEEDGDVVTPLLGEVKELKEVAKDYQDKTYTVQRDGKPIQISYHSDVAEGLRKMNDEFSMRSVRGDGNCLPRALFDSLALQNVDFSAFLNDLAPRVASYNDKALTASYEAVKKIPYKDFTPPELARHQGHSDSWVHFLRLLACADNEKNGGEGFVNFAIATQGSVKDYLKKMRSMTSLTPGELPEMGDLPEIRAWAETLGIRIRLIDAQRIGHGMDPLNPHLFVGDEEAPIEVALLHRPLHYDLAIPKN